MQSSGSSRPEAASGPAVEPEEGSRDPLAELSEIAADLAGYAAWEGLTGAFGIPRPPPGAGEALFGAPVDLRVGVDPRAAGAPARPASAPPPLRRDPAPAAPIAASPIAASPPAASPPAASPPVSRGAGPLLDRAVPPGGQVTLSARWTSIVAERAPPEQALQRVREDLGDCQRCGLCERRKSIVFGVGDPAARLVIVGEAPGAREDELGEPFVGAAGEMLDRMLENVLGLKRQQVYILNVVKCRPPENRDPLPAEIAACRPFLDRQIDAIDPKIMLCVGRIATQTLLNTTRGISGLRGRWHSYRERIPLMATFHPAYLLRSPDEKRKTLEDLLMVKERLVSLG